MFVNGDLKGKFIMDRNLGARDTKRSLDGAGIIVYQFGRKDPFTKDNSNQAKNTFAFAGREEVYMDLDLVSTSNGETISKSISNPMQFYGTLQNWADGVDSETYIWNDFETNVANHGKSIFDPSPKGWKVPHIDTWSNFDTNSMTDWDSTTETMGRSYPRGDNPFAYYPCQGFTNNIGTGGFSSYNVIWSSTPANTIYSYRLWMLSSGTVDPLFSNARGSAFPTRSVQHYEE